MNLYKITLASIVMLFISTGIITLLGIIELVVIKDKYMDWLLPTVIGECIAAVLLYLKKGDPKELQKLRADLSLVNTQKEDLEAHLTNSESYKEELEKVKEQNKALQIKLDEISSKQSIVKGIFSNGSAMDFAKIQDELSDSGLDKKDILIAIQQLEENNYLKNFGASSWTKA